MLAPRSKWRREVVPKPREGRDPCAATRAKQPEPALHVAVDHEVLPSLPPVRTNAGGAGLVAFPRASRALEEPTGIVPTLYYKMALRGEELRGACNYISCVRHV